jgi:UDP-N-acetylenolpyruvoylglucosamine reductase
MSEVLPPALARELAEHLSPASMIRRDEPLGRRTTLRVGGTADLYVEPGSESDLARVLQFCSQRRLPCFVLGRGSNLLVKDSGFRGVVICLVRPALNFVTVNGDRVQCGAGAKLKAVAYEARRCSLAGLEFLEGIPGSVGGALRMNAGAMGGAIFDRVESVRLMDLQGQAREVLPSDMQVGYRSCLLLKDHVAVSAVLRGEPGVAAEIERRMNEFSQKRWSSQPAAPSAGCMFKNPAGIPAGRLIDELGLKGTRIGGAIVSVEHANFLVNDGSATARDVLDLIEFIRCRARTERGIELEREVEVVGE